MADGDKPGAGAIPANPILWLVLAATGTWYFFGSPGLQGTRPSTPDVPLSQVVGQQDVPARLWQDPFAAVRDRPKAVAAPEGDKKPEPCERPYCASDALDSKETTILGVMVSGAIYAEDSEFRRRIRYAVLAGLNVGGYQPSDSQHLGLYSPVLGDKTSRGVPFEWMNLDGHPKQSKAKDKVVRRVLVLWLDEDSLSLPQVDEIVCKLASHASAARIIGPEQSGKLLEFLDNTKELKCADKLEIYSYAATIEWKHFPDSVAPCGGQLERERCFVSSGIRFHRTIADDEVTARMLHHELCRRDVNPGPAAWKPRDMENHVALISEWDTLYGKTVRETMAHHLSKSCNDRASFERTVFGKEGKREKDTEDRETREKWIHSYSYLRGLDGKLPAKEAAPTKEQQQSPTTQGTLADPSKLSTTYAAPQAAGQGQFDYLSRLSSDIARLNEDLHKEGKTLRAIGVLGSDLYDKLLVLQALRPKFPDMVFFTTDLDARLLDTNQQWATHNLIVASAFDLRLPQPMQGEIPPFRDSYQTAAFYAVGLAIGTILNDEAIQAAQIFQIGRTRAVPLTPSLLKPAEAISAPRGFNMHDAGSMAGTAFLLIGVTAALVWAVTREVRSFLQRRTKNSLAMLVLAGGMLMVAVVACILISLAPFFDLRWLVDLLTENGGGEPLNWDEGTTLWPTIAIRLFSCVLCVWLLLRISKSLHKNLDELAEAFQLAGLRERLREWHLEEDKRRNPFRKIKQSFCYRPSRPFAATDLKLSKEAAAFWDKFLYKGKEWARFRRVGVGLLLGIALFLALWGVCGFPYVSHRGNNPLAAYYFVTFLDLLLMLLVTGYVADATFLSCIFVKEFPRTEKDASPQAWPKATYDNAQKILNYNAARMDDWLKLYFVSRRSECVTRLIYAPFFIIALTIVSGSQFFRDFAVNWPISIIQGAALLIAISCAYALRVYAEKARRGAEQELLIELISAKGCDKTQRQAGQVEILLALVRGLDSGAFTPWSQQPLVRALLLPLGSLGGTALLQHLLLPGT